MATFNAMNVEWEVKQQVLKTDSPSDGRQSPKEASIVVEGENKWYGFKQK